MRFIILNFRSAYGVWQFETTAEASSIPNIVNMFDHVQQKAGTIINIPFSLTVEKVTSQKPNSKSTFPVVQITPILGGESLELLYQQIAQGRRVHGLITENKIKQIEIMQE